MHVLTASRRVRHRSFAGPLLIVVAVVALLVMLPTLIPALNPFKEDTVDRTGPVLLKSLEDLSEYRAASANLEVVVDVEEDTNLVPAFIKGERTLLVAAGNVDAAVEFGALCKSPGAVQVSDDRKAVTITLPPPHLTEAELDQSRTRVVDRDRGAIDRIGEALSDDGGADQQQLYVLAEQKLRAAAASDPALIERAQDNTRTMLEGMMRGLGFERVTVRFEQPKV
jgi:hypothetical protein